MRECHGGRTSRSCPTRRESKIGHRAYSLLWNNCEHFASWCSTGLAGSRQVTDVARRVPGAAFMLAGPVLAWTGLVVLSAAFGRLAASAADPHAMAVSRTP
ncbi:MAG: lecithin retinol acyltransferase family protein [Streptosporangiaceae bacterium]